VNRITSFVLMRLFVWSGSKLFPFVDVYVPDNDTVRGIAFAVSEEEWENMRRNDDGN